MAEKKSESKPLIGIGTIFLLLIVGIFIIWVLTGGPSGSKEIIKIKTTEKSTWPATDEIPSYGIYEDN